MTKVEYCSVCFSCLRWMLGNPDAPEDSQDSEVQLFIESSSCIQDTNIYIYI